MAKEKVILSPQEKAKKDLKVAEIVYYSIGGVVLLLGLLCSICGVILLNPVKQNFEDFFLKEAETAIFTWLKWETNFANAGLILLLIAFVYFLLVFSIFVKKADEVSKKSDFKKSRQRQVVFVAPAPVVEENKEEVQA